MQHSETGDMKNANPDQNETDILIVSQERHMKENRTTETETDCSLNFCDFLPQSPFSWYLYIIFGFIWKKYYRNGNPAL